MKGDNTLGQGSSEVDPGAWFSPPGHLFPPEFLPDREVHVWLADLRLPALRLSSVASNLAEVEWARARRFRAPQDRARFTAQRGILRDILGRYTGFCPRLLEFGAGRYGKPCLTKPTTSLTFSASHSHTLALYAVGKGQPLGVDLERVRNDLPVAELAMHAFTVAERDAFGVHVSEADPDGFFSAWTRKEACLKARGTGFLSQPCDALPHGWALCELAPAPGYVAALAVKGTGGTLKLWRWPG